jgi:SAM-dependent methyltransferase
MRHVYARLITDWLGAPVPGPALKTDLFEEAITPHHVLGDLGRGSLGLDCSLAIAHAAQRRLGSAHRLLVADLRNLPIRDGGVASILAGSSLDHFPHSRDIDICLAEIARVLKPGGVLVITFDNPRNPVVWLRNLLPFAWLNRLGIVPYYVGTTYGFAEAARALTTVGLRVTAMRAVAHAPRVLAVWAAALCGRFIPGFLEQAFERWEALARLPTSSVTAYYVALRAEKRSDGSYGPGFVTATKNDPNSTGVSAAG